MKNTKEILKGLEESARVVPYKEYIKLVEHIHALEKRIAHLDWGKVVGEMEGKWVRDVTGDIIALDGTEDDLNWEDDWTMVSYWRDGEYLSHQYDTPKQAAEVYERLKKYVPVKTRP